MQRILVLIILSAGCAAPAGGRVDLAAEQASLLAVYESGKRAHLDTDVDALMEQVGAELIGVGAGAIDYQSRQQVREFFTGYFADASYQEYRDLEAPIVRVSPDGRMGWVISRLRARRTQPDAGGAIRERTFTYAGIMVYEKVDAVWTLTATVSTFE